MPDVDPMELSRISSRAEESAWAWQDRLSELAIVEDAPLEEWRNILGKQFIHEFLEELGADDPLRPFLLRWLTHLLELRVNAATYTECARLRYHDVHALEAPERTKATIDQMSRKVLGEERREQWLKSLAPRGQRLAETVLHLWQRRVEVYNRLNGPSLDETELPTPAVYTLAEEALRLTEPLTAELSGLSKALAHVTKPSPLNFPAHLSAPALSDWFRDTRLLESVKLRSFNWPKPLGATSFALAMDRFGATWQRALAPSNQPFVVAVDPLGLSEQTNGWLFANLLATPAFQRRHLGGAATKQRDINRFWGMAGVHELRLRATRVLTRQALLLDHRERPRALEHLGERVWGEPLHKHLVGVLPQLRSSDPQRFCAIALGTLLRQSIIDAHDEDWFRNPRAVDELRSNAARPPSSTTSPETVKLGLQLCVEQLTSLIG